MSVGDRSNLRGLAVVLREVKAALRARRRELGRTQHDVAAAMGSSQSTYAAWEVDDRRSDALISSVFRAADALDLDVEIRLVPRGSVEG